MRIAPMLLASLFFVIPGCSDNSDDSGDDVLPGTAPTVKGELPENISASESFLVAIDVFNLAGMPPCSTPVSTCTTYPFHVNENTTANLTATIEWAFQVNDFDMYLYQGDTQVSSDGINNLGDVPGTTQTMRVSGLEEGDYEIVIAAWLVVMDGYNLSATFD